MSVLAPIGEPRCFNYTYPYRPGDTTGGLNTGTCILHGSYVGYQCPVCVSVVPPPQPAPLPPQIVTTSPGTTEDAIAAMVKAFDQIINDLRVQLAERDRQIAEYLVRDQERIIGEQSEK